MELTSGQYKELSKLSEYLKEIKKANSQLGNTMNSLSEEYKNGHYPVYPRKSKKKSQS